jgi:hypothetical protein
VFNREFYSGYGTFELGAMIYFRMLEGIELAGLKMLI